MISGGHFHLEPPPPPAINSQNICLKIKFSQIISYPLA